jgi:head-tail adaptor
MLRGHNRHLLRVEKKVQTKTSSGAISYTWVLFTNLWVKIETIRVYEKQSAQASWPGADIRITGDWVDGLLGTMRLVSKDKIYSVLNINNVEERNREVEFICQTGLKSA